MGKKYGENLPPKSQLIKFQDQISALRSEANSIELRFAYEKIPYSADMIAEKIKAQKGQAIKKEDPSDRKPYNQISLPMDIPNLSEVKELNRV